MSKTIVIVLYNARCEFRDVAKKHFALVQNTFFTAWIIQVDKHKFAA